MSFPAFIYYIKPGDNVMVKDQPLRLGGGGLINKKLSVSVVCGMSDDIKYSDIDNHKCYIIVESNKHNGEGRGKPIKVFVHANDIDCLVNLEYTNTIQYVPPPPTPITIPQFFPGDIVMYKDIYRRNKRPITQIDAVDSNMPLVVDGIHPDYKNLILLKSNLSKSKYPNGVWVDMNHIEHTDREYNCHNHPLTSIFVR